MSSTTVQDPAHGGGAGGSEHHPEIDWDAAANSAEFHELTRKRRSFVAPALAFVFVWYFGFIALAGYAPDFMGESIYEGFTVGYGLALTQFVMTWFLGWLYLRRSDRDFDPLARAAAERAVTKRDEASAASERREPTRRFDPAAHDGEDSPAPSREGRR